MSEIKANRTYKDTLFRLIFSIKVYALALYNAVNKTNYTDIKDLKVITLEDAMFINVRNDVGYIFHDIMSIFEQQAKFNPNMAFRGLGYIGNSLRQYIAETYKDMNILHGEELIRIPTPRYYVFYNGTKDQPEEQILRLSSSYEGEGDIEVTAHMLNINKGHNKKLLDACKPLRDYSELVDRVRTNKDSGMSNEEAVMKAVDSCIEDGIFADILRKEMAIVRDILISGITEEEKERLHEREKQNAVDGAVKDLNEKLSKTQEELDETRTALKKAKADRLKVQHDIAARLISELNTPIEKACELAGITVEDYNSLK